jgi:hypothetical protein
MVQKIDEIADDMLAVISSMRRLQQYHGTDDISMPNLDRLEFILLMIQQLDQMSDINEDDLKLK